MFGFVGPNGAGKTTTMRIVLGVLAARRRRGALERRARSTRDDRRRIGYMPEERGLYPKMRVGEQLAYLAELHGIESAEARPAGRALDGAAGRRRARRRHGRGALARQPAARAARRGARARARPARARRAVLGARPRRRRRAQRGAARGDQPPRRAGRVLLPSARAGRAPLRRRGDRQRRAPGRRRHRRASCAPAAASGRWRVEVDAADAAWARARARACGPSRTASSSWTTAPTRRRCSTRRAPAGAVRRFGPDTPTLAELFRAVVAEPASADAARPGGRA